MVEELMLNNAREGQKVLYAVSRMAQRGARELQAVESEGDVVKLNAPSQLNAAAIPFHSSSSQMRQQSSFVQITNHNGKMKKIEVQQSTDPSTGELVTRMFINGVEVDPQTKKPLTQAPAPSAAKDDAPEEQAPPVSEQDDASEEESF